MAPAFAAASLFPASMVVVIRVVNVNMKTDGNSQVNIGTGNQPDDINPLEH